MKESELISMKKKIEALSRLTEFLLNEVENSKLLSVGTYQTLKEMPGYEDAIKIITEKAKKQDEKDNTKTE